MAGNLIIGAECLQSWWLPGDEARSNGWVQKYEDDLRKPKDRNISAESSPHNKSEDVERQLPLVSESKAGEQMLHEKMSPGELEPHVGFPYVDSVQNSS